MAGLGKKILSAFVEVNSKPPKPADDKEKSIDAAEAPQRPEAGRGAAAASQWRETKNAANQRPEAPEGSASQKKPDARFAEYFDKLFREANIPGPDYYEFSAMVAALQAVPDEAARFMAAFAGLKVQGLDREKLLSTAAEYLRVLDSDAGMFNSTVDAALQEKVHGRKKEAEEKRARIQDLSKEIGELQAQVQALESEIGENEEKIGSRHQAYIAESAERRSLIESDIMKIKNYLH